MGNFVDVDDSVSGAVNIGFAGTLTPDAGRTQIDPGITSLDDGTPPTTFLNCIATGDTVSFVANHNSIDDTNIPFGYFVPSTKNVCVNGVSRVTNPPNLAAAAISVSAAADLFDDITELARVLSTVVSGIELVDSIVNFVTVKLVVGSKKDTTNEPTSDKLPYDLIIVIFPEADPDLSVTRGDPANPLGPGDTNGE